MMTLESITLFLKLRSLFLVWMMWKKWKPQTYVLISFNQFNNHFQNAFDVMGFEPKEKNDLYKICAAIMHMGEMKFKQKPREEQAEVDDMNAATDACKLFAINVEQFIGAL